MPPTDAVLLGRKDIGRTGNGERMMKSKLHDDAMTELYRGDPAFAIDVINDILEDNDQGELLNLMPDHQLGDIPSLSTVNLAYQPLI